MNLLLEIAMLADTYHRPWPVPHRSWVLAMQWHDLLFMHWPVKADRLRPHLPEALTVDTYDGDAYLGVVPFRMRGVRPRFSPALPRVSAFPELNVRTYVVHDGRPGVWFFSLDAASPLAVRVARATYHLPYFDARMEAAWEASALRYHSRRVHRGAPAADLRMRYRPVGPPVQVGEGTLAQWLTERYGLYAGDGRGRLWRGDIHHARWPLQPAEAEVEVNTMAEPLGLTLPNEVPLLHFAERLDVVAWTPERIR